ERAEAGGPGGAIADERWFVAMRKDLEGRAAAIEEAEASPDSDTGSLRALVELRDALVNLYTDRLAAERVALLVNLQLHPTTRPLAASTRWLELLEKAYTENRIPAVLAAVETDHPKNPALASAIQEYWIRLSPTLRVDGGRFETPPREWELLERH